MARTIAFDIAIPTIGEGAAHELAADVSRLLDALGLYPRTSRKLTLVDAIKAAADRAVELRKESIESQDRFVDLQAQWTAETDTLKRLVADMARVLS